jgi:hypothetical protein
VKGVMDLDQFPRKVDIQSLLDKIEGDKIILDGKGYFPKRLIIILESGKKREYRIVKTRNGGFILN